MVDEAKDKSTEAPDGAQSEAQADKRASRRDLIKYVIIGAAGLIAVTVIAVVLMVVLGGREGAPTAEAPTSAETAAEQPDDSKAKQQVSQKAGQTPANDMSAKSETPVNDSPGFVFDENDSSTLKYIRESLEFLDYDPTGGHDSSKGSEENDAIASPDTTAASNWLAGEKSKLAAREKDLEKREKDLQQLDKQVSKKLMVLEQAESTRTAELAKLYDGMDARAVAKLMLNLDDETIVAILPRMKQKNASQVLSLFSPERAARLSKKLITIAEN